MLKQAVCKPPRLFLRSSNWSRTRINVRSMSSSDRVLYWGSGSPPCWRVQIAMEEKGLKYESKLISFSEKGHKSDEILALNPRGQVPTYKEGSTIINESMAIVQWLEVAHPHRSLMPKGKEAERFHEATSLQNAQMAISQARRSAGNMDENAVGEKIAGLKRELGFWDKYLANGFVAGDSFTIADCAAAPYFLIAERFGAKFSEFPNIKKYVATLKASWPPHWKDTPNQDWLTI
eukprot:jgi/Astpho2/644/Aster-04484